MAASYYLRVSIDGIQDENHEGDNQPIDVSDNGLELTFVDLYTRLRTPYSPSVSQAESLTNAVQDHRHLCSKTDLVVLRWPWIVGPGDETHTEQINNWIQRLTGQTGKTPDEPVFASGIRVGVIQHRVADEPILCWDNNPAHCNDATLHDDGILHHARRVEVEYLLRHRNAVWEPKEYHYRLPSGEHSDVFIRVADAINEPQDAYVMACWLSNRIENGCGVVVDTGGLTPILIQLESFLNQHKLKIGPTAILQAYPAGRPAVRKIVESVQISSEAPIVGVLSVNSTGSLLNTLMDELDRVFESDGINYTLDVIVDNTSANDIAPISTPNSNTNKLNVWINRKREAETESSGSCGLCRNATKATVIGVDPRTYGAMTLPGPHLVMPDTHYATAGSLFWERAVEHRAIAIEANPHQARQMARGKRIALPVRPIFELIAQANGLEEVVTKRWREISEEHRQAKNPEKECGLAERFHKTGLVVATEYDISRHPIPAFAGNGNRNVDFKESLRCVLSGIGVAEDTPIVDIDDESGIEQQICDLASHKSIMVFSWRSVTGLTLRRLKLQIADILGSKQVERSLNGLVFHARPSSPDEWTAQQNQFKPDTLECLWSSCFPWSSPLRDENLLLDTSDIDLHAISDSARMFLERRKQFLNMHDTYSEQEDDWSPRFESSTSQAHPEHIFWGMSHDNIHQKQVRGRSLYGKELDCLTAYAAMGSVINYTRLNEHPKAAPRWVMFNMSRIVRSYFDAVIVCSMIRWLQPGELWWAERDDPVSIRESLAFLLDQAAEVKEQVLLVPELLLATVQGKIPALAHDIVLEKAKAVRSTWPQNDKFKMARGAVEIGLALLSAESRS
ncbi:MAG: hypothetical protein OXI96_06050 [Acidimicrobiaceae bacterium]|nr:hypothetical protein [Acidimicrobiaceae bacterium]